MIGKDDIGRLEEAGRILRSIEGVAGAVVVLFRENFQQADVVDVGCPAGRALDLTGQAIAALLEKKKRDDGQRIIVPSDFRRLS